MKDFKNKRYKQILVSIMLLLSAGATTAQEHQLPQGEFSVYLKGPYSKLRIDMGNWGDSDNRFGAGFGAQYSHYLSQAWSLSGALEYQSYRSKTILNSFADSYSLTDAEGDDMVFRSSASLYREWQSAGMLNVPLRIQWETQGEMTRLFAAAGIQLGLPLFANYKGTAYGLKTSGYFPQWDAELNSPRFMGFGSWETQQSGKEKLKLKSSYSLLFELGFKQTLRAMRYLYVGTYVELGLNDISKSGNIREPIIGYNITNPTAFEYSSVVNASPQANGESYTRKVSTQGLGLKMRYAFSW